MEILYRSLVCFLILLITSCDRQNLKNKKDNQTTNISEREVVKTVQIPQVKYVAAYSQPVFNNLELPGRVIASNVVEIRPKISGTIVERLYQEGDFVNEGDDLYRIDSTRYELKHQKRLAELQRAQAVLISVQNTARRLNDLSRSENVTTQALEDANLKLSQAEADVRWATLNVEAAKMDLDATRIKAPISGFAGKSLVVRGAFVSPDRPEALTSIKILDPVYVDFSQSNEEVRGLASVILKLAANNNQEQALNVKLRVRANGENYSQVGKLGIAEISDGSRGGSVLLRAVVPNPNLELVPGNIVDATIEGSVENRQIVVPEVALAQNQNGENFVWIIDKDNIVRVRNIETGLKLGKNWTIVNGLELGERVVVENSNQLKVGQQVNPIPMDEAQDDTLLAE